MIFDDHDVVDDWNTSAAWVDEMRHQDWWNRRVVGAFMAYALYQHWGNLNPDTLEQDPVYQRVREAGDGGKILAEAAFKWDREVVGGALELLPRHRHDADRDDRPRAGPRARPGPAPRSTTASGGGSSSTLPAASTTF